MLEYLRIRGLGVIEDAELDLSPGLTVLTGETGAGKTMVVTALGLLLGGRADPGAVRPGERAAVVEGRVAVPATHPAARLAQEAGADLDEGTLILARTVSAEGRSRAHAGGRSVPVALLGALGEDLMAVHGQHDQRRLLHPVRQREALDRFAGTEAGGALVRYAHDHARLLDVRRELAELTTHARERAREVDLLRLGLGEVQAVEPLDGEDIELAAEERRLAHADGLREAASAAHTAVLGDPQADSSSRADGSGRADRWDPADAVGLVAAARRALLAAAEDDKALGVLAERLTEVSYLLSDVGSDLASYAASVDTDPARLAAVQARRGAITRLTRKYGDTAADVLAWAASAAVRLADLEDDDGRIDRRRAEESELLARLATGAADLSRLRTAAAGRLAAAVTSELAALAMPRASLSVALTQTEHAEEAGGLLVGGRRLAFGPTGVDDVAMLLTPHAGAGPRPLRRGASGGELSRVMLAIEVVLAGRDPVATLVFDEVDAGVGGRAAVEIGRRLRLLAADCQVLVVTHLPQVAAFADRHLLVAKDDDGRVTRSGVVGLDDAARVLELSRMLAGLEGSDSARAHAEELLATARGGTASSGA